jgi:hypothetical protein
MDTKEKKQKIDIETTGTQASTKENKQKIDIETKGTQASKIENKQKIDIETTEKQASEKEKKTLSTDAKATRYIIFKDTSSAKKNFYSSFFGFLDGGDRSFENYISKHMFDMLRKKEGSNKKYVCLINENTTKNTYYCKYYANI